MNDQELAEALQEFFDCQVSLRWHLDGCGGVFCHVYDMGTGTLLMGTSGDSHLSSTESLRRKLRSRITKLSNFLYRWEHK